MTNAATAWRGRATAFAAAFVLAVLLTAAGVPASAWHARVASHATAVDGSVSRVVQRGPKLLHCAPSPVRSLLPASSTRPLPRALCTLCGGLPPARAP